MTIQSSAISAPRKWAPIAAPRETAHPNTEETNAMAQERQQLDEEVAALLKARSKIDGKLDAAREKRANWREGDEERISKPIKRE